ncbi:uncharacterized protein BDR25DRAFT_268976 [Lindgomyces ingoldianus]|uniref:Uncharacterized protein n=1 Tax=Lindgomyces ingoldianus TaxID=673940 RepID=A0ACB6QJW9_9PLEO|nr:uncharacterized protein BDR25DRAFT_268976 [Lindgomyces ingoldianus]KAF2466430.1 hypothetical protein BDR25DRAFT_268976 [Lindgomyces ingoldianus]
MSVSRSSNTVANQGEFHSREPRDEPMMTSGHKPGVLASEADRAPEFSAQPLPAGRAPKSSTYEPNPDLHNQGMYQAASSTLTGADSADVHTGYGHPGQGQSSAELHHDGEHHRKRQGMGLAGLAETENKGQGVRRQDPAFGNQRNLGEGVSVGQTAEERIPEGAESVAAGRK